MSAFDDEPIYVTVPGSPDDPRATGVPSGVVPRHMPALHPDDVTIVRGVPVTSLARTLVDLAEVLTSTRKAYRRGARPRSRARVASRECAAGPQSRRRRSQARPGR